MRWRDGTEPAGSAKRRAYGWPRQWGCPRAATFSRVIVGDRLDTSRSPPLGSTKH